MARMLPARIYADTKSPGEHEVFERLRDDPKTADWIVLHSLDIAQHVRRVAGEADFVIIVPTRGVLCLEVKATSRIRREQGLWYYGSDPIPDSRGPFKQSSEAMHSIRKRVAEKDPDLGSVLFWSAVLFPYFDFRITSDEWHPWQVINGSTYEQQSLSSAVLTVFNKAREHVGKHTGSWYSATRSAPTKQQCERIAGILRPDFEFFAPPRVQISQLKTEVRKFTEEQFTALDAMEGNDRVVFTGPAGTGKTLLALEAARRSTRSSRRVLFLCFNKQLAKKLAEDTQALSAHVTVTHLHKHMMVVAGENFSSGRDIPSEYWTKDLPDKAVEQILLSKNDQFIFDELIVDEAQDMLRASYLDFLDLSLKGGLGNGRWRFFGDFERQAIYEATSNVTLDEAIKNRLGKPTVFSLRINCRNTPRVASFVELLSNMSPGYTRILRPDDKREPRLKYFADADSQRDLLIETLDELIGLGFSNADITVLSTRANASAVARSVRGVWESRLCPIEDAGSKHVRYGSIHSFKGLESPAVLVTDVEHIGGDRAASLFYVAMTRPLSSLTILISSRARDELLRLLLKRV